MRHHKKNLFMRIAYNAWTRWLYSAGSITLFAYMRAVYDAYVSLVHICWKRHSERWVEYSIFVPYACIFFPSFHSRLNWRTDEFKAENNCWSGDKYAINS